MKHAMTVFFLSTGAALAHGGHDEAVLRGETHWLTTGDHVIVLVLTCFALGLCARPVLRRLGAALKRA
jgi:hypothetical protein